MPLNTDAAYLAATAAALLLSVAAQQQIKSQKLLKNDQPIKLDNQRSRSLRPRKVPKRYDSEEFFMSEESPPPKKKTKLKKGQMKPTPKSSINHKDDQSICPSDSQRFNFQDNESKELIKEELDAEAVYSDKLVIKEEFLIKDEPIEDSNILLDESDEIDKSKRKRPKDVVPSYPLAPQDYFAEQVYSDKLVIKEEFLIKDEPIEDSNIPLDESDEIGKSKRKRPKDVVPPYPLAPQDYFAEQANEESMEALVCHGSEKRLVSPKRRKN